MTNLVLTMLCQRPEGALDSTSTAMYEAGEDGRKEKVDFVAGW